jgi:hypothetical protein
MQTTIAMATIHRSHAHHGKGEISDTVMETIKHEKEKATPYYTKQQTVNGFGGRCSGLLIVRADGIHTPHKHVLI